jgi:hypothetical protein
VDATTGEVGVAGAYMSDSPTPLATVGSYEQVRVAYAERANTTDFRIVGLAGWTLREAPAGTWFRFWGDQPMPWDVPAET